VNNNIINRIIELSKPENIILFARQAEEEVRSHRMTTNQNKNKKIK